MTAHGGDGRGDRDEVWTRGLTQGGWTASSSTETIAPAPCKTGRLILVSWWRSSTAGAQLCADGRLDTSTVLYSERQARCLGRGARCCRSGCLRRQVGRAKTGPSFKYPARLTCPLELSVRDRAASAGLHTASPLFLDSISVNVTRMIIVSAGWLVPITAWLCVYELIQRLPSKMAGRAVEQSAYPLVSFPTFRRPVPRGRSQLKPRAVR